MTENFIDLLVNGDIEGFNKAIHSDNCDLTECDFQGLEIVDADFSNLDISGCNFSETSLENVNFENSDLSATVFSRANISNCSFIGATLSGTSFSNAQVTYCDFTDSDLSGCDFIETDLTDSDMSLALNMNKCRFDKFTVFPDSDKLPSDFDSSYEDDLASLNEEEDSQSDSDY